MPGYKFYHVITNSVRLLYVFQYYCTARMWMKLMLLLLVATLIIYSPKQGAGQLQDIKNLSVCINSDNNYLLVEWKPPFPHNVDTLDIHCSSMNDSFRKSCTVQLPSDLDTEISVNVPVSGSGVHLGYVYMIQAILHTTDGDQIEKDIIAKASYFQGIHWLFNNNNSITFRCVFSNTCGALIGGCTVTLISQTDGKSINQTIPVVEGKNVVEGSFNNLNLSESYYYTVSVVKQDLMTPIGTPFSEILPAMTLNNNSYDIVYPTQSSVMPTISEDPAISTSTATLLPRSTIVVLTQPISTGIGKDSTSGRNEPSSKGFPHIAIIGIVCGAALVAVFIFAVIMIILRRLRPERNISVTDNQNNPLIWGKFDPKTEGRLHPTIVVIDDGSTEDDAKDLIDKQTVKMSKLRSVSVPDEIDNIV